MQIQDMFAKSIDRNIEGVVKVDQDSAPVVRQELEEYVVTHEVAGLLASFYDKYEAAIDRPNDKIGVWISGFFGSGKSHFLKMLSYLLSNRSVDGTPAIGFFENKVEDAVVEARMKRVADTTCGETILFNIEDKRVGAKDAGAITRTFARVFADHRGFYGEDATLARLEAYIEKQGKTEAFRAAFEEVAGEPWVDARPDYEFNQEDVVDALANSDVMTRGEAEDWFANRVNVRGTADEMGSVDSLTTEICAYAERRERELGKPFRLVFMIDEVGQFIGDNTDLMLSLQTIVESLGVKGAGRVWVMVTSQEAIDEVTKVAGNDFSKIQGRFDTRLSLSSSGVDEVIQRRILEKTPTAAQVLDAEYAEDASVLANLFTFKDATADLRGFRSADEFSRSFPFPSYQFRIAQRAMSEIRKHGSSGKHLSSGERSMISGFKETAQAVKTEDQRTLVPFWSFYDTLVTFMESHIRQVINRADAAARAGEGLEPQDVEVLKLLYLVLYVDDVPSSLENLVVMMTSSIDEDRMALRASVQESLDRLVKENYVGRTNETYRFLTDDEQEIARQIAREEPDNGTMVNAISDALFNRVFEDTKVSVGANSFPVEKRVDGIRMQGNPGGLQFEVRTPISETVPRQQLLLDSSGKAVLVLPEDAPYWDKLYRAAQIDSYIKKKNFGALSPNERKIVQARQEESADLKKEAQSEMYTAVANGALYVNGEEVQNQGMAASNRIDDALKRLVDSVYSKLDLIQSTARDDSDVTALLHNPLTTDGDQGNAEAVLAMRNYLTGRKRNHIKTSMEDVQRMFQDKPFGWREVDVAATMARLIAAKDVEVRVAGAVLAPTDSKLPGYLRKPRLTPNADVRIRERVSENTLARSRDVIVTLCKPGRSLTLEEDALHKGAQEELEKLLGILEGWLGNEYRRNPGYPGHSTVADAKNKIKGLLDLATSPSDFLQAISGRDDELEDLAEDLEDVRTFFNGQAPLWDKASKLAGDSDERDYLEFEPAVAGAYKTLDDILGSQNPYGRIKDLGDPMQVVERAHDEAIAAKRDELERYVSGIFADIEDYAHEKGVTLPAIAQQRTMYEKQARGMDSLVALDALKTRVTNAQNHLMADVDREYARINAPKPPTGRINRDNPSETSKQTPASAAPPKPNAMRVPRTAVFMPVQLGSAADVDSYLDKVRSRLIQRLADANGPIRLS